MSIAPHACACERLAEANVLGLRRLIGENQRRRNRSYPQPKLAKIAFAARKSWLAAAIVSCPV
jgi:hypothetical protein